MAGPSRSYTCYLGDCSGKIEEEDEPVVDSISDSQGRAVKDHGSQPSYRDDGENDPERMKYLQTAFERNRIPLPKLELSDSSRPRSYLN